MKANNDFFRRASLFTMNGMVDPRMMPGYKGTMTPAKRTRDNGGVSFYVRLWLKLFSLKNAAR